MRKYLYRAYVGLIFIFLYAPVVVLIVFSFNNDKSRSIWKGFTLKWYEQLFSDREIMSSLYTTAKVAILAAVISTVLGAAAAVGIYAYRSKKLRAAVMTVNNIPMVNPEIVTGISLMFLFVILYRMGIGAFHFGFFTLLLAHVTFCVPYVVLSILPKLRQMDRNLYYAARDLGCNGFKAFFKVVLPDIMPGIVTGFVMALTLSLDDFVISYFTTGPSAETLSIRIYAMTKKRISPEINALSTLMFVVVLVLLLLINLNQFVSSKKKVREDY